MEYEKEKQPGISIKKSKLSLAFTLITFLVADLILTHKTVSVSVDLSELKDLTKESFLDLKKNMVEGLEKEGRAVLDFKQSVLLYALIDLCCKAMVSDSNVYLAELAEKNMGIPPENYKQVRMSYIHYAQKLIDNMNELYGHLEAFKKQAEILKG